jgi:predicted regulator of Ras-like GTPase activity (Roadblock/LC7/MglB family)
MTDYVSLAQTLTRGNPDVLGLLVVDGDGRVHASESTSEDVVRAAAAVAVPLRELLDRAANELGCGEMSATVVEGRDASLAIADIDGFRSVVVIGAAGAAPGGLRADSLWIAERLRAEGSSS